MLVVHQTAAKHSAAMAPGRDAVDIHDDIARGKRRGEYLVDEAFLGLAFGKNVKPDQCEGLPPTTFFSHNSDNV